jgi:hypothetical protein
MQSVPLCHPFHRLNCFALRLRSQHQTGAYKPTIENHAARAAITSQAPFFSAGEPEHLTEHFEQTLTRLTHELNRLAIKRSFNVYFSRHVSLPSFSKKQ